MKKIRIGSKFTVPRPRKPFKITVTNVTSTSVIGLDARGRKWRVPFKYLAKRAAPEKRVTTKRPAKKQQTNIRHYRGMVGVRTGPHDDDWEWYSTKEWRAISNNRKFFIKVNIPRGYYTNTPNGRKIVLGMIGRDAQQAADGRWYHLTKEKAAAAQAQINKLTAIIRRNLRDARDMTRPGRDY